MKLKTKMRGLRARLAGRRAERVVRLRLSDELAAYQTPAERAELDLILGRHTREETREIRAILARQDSQRQRAGNLMASPRG
jgi:hypothetical protein